MVSGIAHMDWKEISNCGSSRQCKAMFKCSNNFNNSKTCVHIWDVCDGINDCPLNDDELLCNLKGHKCPNNCTCLNLAIFCHTTILNMPKWYEMPYISYHISEVALQNINFLPKDVGVDNLVFIKTGLTEVCTVLHKQQHLFSVNFTDNNISRLISKCFNNMKFMKFIILTNNRLKYLEKGSFRLDQVHTIDLSKNNLNKISKHWFINTTSIGILDISHNPLSKITLNMFTGILVKTVITTYAPICCIKPSESVCSLEANVVSACSELLPSSAMKIISILLSIIIFSLNIPWTTKLWISINRIKSSHMDNSVKKAYQYFLVSVSLSSSTGAVLLTILWAASFSFGDSFVIYWEEWQKSISCSVVFSFNMIFHILMPYFMSLISIARLLVVLFPFDSNFKTPSYVRKHVLFGLLSVVILSDVITVANYSSHGKLSETLCSPFMIETRTKVEPKIHTIFLLSIQITATIVMSCAYYLLSKKLKSSQQNIHKEGSQKKVKISPLIFLVCHNAILWLSESIIFVWTLFLSRDSQHIAIWGSLIITPFGAITNPMFFMLTSIWAQNLQFDIHQNHKTVGNVGSQNAKEKEKQK